MEPARFPFNSGPRVAGLAGWASALPASWFGHPEADVTGDVVLEQLRFAFARGCLLAMWPDLLGTLLPQIDSVRRSDFAG